MQYISTRGGGGPVSFEESLYSGYTGDGGMLMPIKIPEVSMETLKTWAKRSYPELLKEVMSLYIPEEELPRDDLSKLVDSAMVGFDNPEIAPMKQLKGGLNVLELFHGGTWAFKDLGLSCVGQLLEYFLSKRRKHLTVVVATSGDTGSAAIRAVRGLKWVDIVVLLPKGRCSQIQELQMTTVIEDNVHVYRAEGTCDDLDIVKKKCFKDHDFRLEHNLCSINSINWTRIMVQTAHFIYAYLQMYPQCDGELDIAVPTGALGNMTAGCVSRLMGLPIRLICTVNENDVVAKAMLTGELAIKPEVVQTLAPAMDIQYPINIERIWYLFSGQKPLLVSRLMEEFESKGCVKAPNDLTTKLKEVIIDAFVANDDLIKKTMRQCFEENSYYICPHTATAVAYHYRSKVGTDDDNRKLVCVGTASVSKFQEAVEAAGLPVKVCPEVDRLKSLPTKFEEMRKGDSWEEILKQKIVDINTNWKMKHC